MLKQTIAQCCSWKFQSDFLCSRGWDAPDAPFFLTKSTGSSSVVSSLLSKPVSMWALTLCFVSSPVFMVCLLLAVSSGLPHQCLAVFCLSLVYIRLFACYCDMWFTVPSEFPAQLVSRCLDFSIFSDHLIYFVSKCGSGMTETVIYWRCDASGLCKAICAATISWTPPSAPQTRNPSCAEDSHLPLFCIQTLQLLLRSVLRGLVLFISTFASFLFPSVSIYAYLPSCSSVFWL